MSLSIQECFRSLRDTFDQAISALDNGESESEPSKRGYFEHKEIVRKKLAEERSACEATSQRVQTLAESFHAKAVAACNRNLIKCEKEQFDALIELCLDAAKEGHTTFYGKFEMPPIVYRQLIDCGFRIIEGKKQTKISWEPK